MTDLVPAPRFTRRDQSDDASEVLTLVRITDGHLAGKRLLCADLDGREYPYLIQVTTGPDLGDDFVGLYDLDGDQVDAAGCSWEVVTEAPAEVIEQVETGWESGMWVVERIVEHVANCDDGRVACPACAASPHSHKTE